MVISNMLNTILPLNKAYFKKMNNTINHPILPRAIINMSPLTQHSVLIAWPFGLHMSMFKSIN